MYNLRDPDFLIISGKPPGVYPASKMQPGIQYMRDQNDIQPNRMALICQLALVTDIEDASLTVNFNFTTNERMFHDHIGHIGAIVNNTIANDAALDGAVGSDNSMRADHGVINCGGRMNIDRWEDNRIVMRIAFRRVIVPMFQIVTIGA